MAIILLAAQHSTAQYIVAAIVLAAIFYFTRNGGFDT